MTYFTRFPINMTRRETRSMLASPYKLHAAVAGSLPPKQGVSADTDRALWRVDRQLDGSALLYIVSSPKPSLIGLDEQMGFPDLEPQWATRDYDPFLEQVKEGQRYLFRLVANPVVSRKAMPNGRGDSKRIGHLTILQQAAWLAGKEAYAGSDKEVPELFANQDISRAERNGFAICSNEPERGCSLIVSDSRKVSFKKSGGRTITLTTARYDGILEVIDADALRHALTHGIGHAKGFGCGLLTLVPY
ncbi:MAG TPA: type I-E CRISPR-associated protein Cas6/Cse3/CasE [Atopobiaceae bacterium]|nr:type I-E CRISPR-associated protein Cas6/Cse3/CasE [Atopobiaceae bacterium]